MEFNGVVTRNQAVCSVFHFFDYVIGWVLELV